MNKTILEKRESLYDNLRNTCALDRDHGIYFDIKLSSSTHNNLKLLALQYIAKTLSVCENKNIIVDDDFLIKYEKKILSLPNRTPNGAFYPKKDNIVEYNKLQKEIVLSLKEVNVLDSFLAIQPCTVRVMSGKSADMDHTRPLSSAKLHSDSWASHVGDAILGISLMGDSSTELEFYKPRGIEEDFFLPLEDYNEGLEKFSDKKFLGCARMGYVSIFDHACLHRTRLNEGNIRVSIDLGVITNNPNSLYYDSLSRNKVNLENYRYEYLQNDVYCRLGDTLFISVEETLEESKLKYLNPKLKNVKSYERAPIKIVEKI